MRTRLVEPSTRADPRLLRRGSRRARLPRGRRTARARAASRRSSATTGCSRRSATSARTSCRPGTGCGAFAELAARVSPRMLIGEEAAVTELWEAARKRLRPTARGPARPARVRLDGAARAGRHGTAARDEWRPRRARPRLRARARGGARRRPAAARRERLPLADARADRGGPLVDLARGRRDPVQGRGVRLDARGGAAAAGLGRPAGAAPGLRLTGAPRPHPAAPRERAGGLPLRARRERRRRSGSTRRSGCGTSWTTGACCF